MSIQNSVGFQNVTAGVNNEPINPFGLQLVQSSTSTSLTVDFLNLNAYPNTTSPYKNFLFTFRVIYSATNGGAFRLQPSSTAGTFTGQSATTGLLTDAAIYNGGTALDLTATYAGNASFWYIYLAGGTAPQRLSGFVYILGMNDSFTSGLGLSYNLMNAASSGSVFNRGDWVSGGGVYAANNLAFRATHNAGTITSASYQLYGMPS